jgi:hypothetical protein
MNILLRTIMVVGMALVLLIAPCLAACPYATTGKTACGSTDNGSCTDTYSLTGNENINIGTVLCEDGNCQAKVCDGTGNCEVSSFSVTGDDNTVSNWFSELFKGNSESSGVSDKVLDSETIKSDEKTSDCAYSVTGSKPSSSNYYGSYALSEDGVNEEKSITPVNDNVTYSYKIKSNSDICNGNDCANKSECDASNGNISVNETDTTKSGCESYDKAYAALKADKTEEKVTSDSYTSKDAAKDICTYMKSQGINCKIIKVTFTDGKVNYLNCIDTCNGELLVDSYGTSQGTGIKKEVTTLEVGKQWTAKSLFGECGKTYTRGIVKSIE